MSEDTKKKKLATIQIRATEFQKNRIRYYANKLNNGNMSDFLLTQAFKAPLLVPKKTREKPPR